MPFWLKLLLSNLVIVSAVLAGRRWPTAGGLLASMPLSTLVVLVWLAGERPGEPAYLDAYLRGVLWGIAPTLCFFLASWWSLRQGWPLPAALAAGLGCWLVGAVLHLRLVS